jgi:transposase-like protein
MNPKKDRPEYEALKRKIESGELSRKQAALAAQMVTGLAPSTFMSWLRSSGALKGLKHTRLSAGQNSHLAHKDPDKVKAYEQAVSAVLEGQAPKRAAEKFGVCYQHLLRKVHQARPPAPMRAPTTPEEDLVAAIMVASRAETSTHSSDMSISATKTDAFQDDRSSRQKKARNLFRPELVGEG